MTSQLVINPLEFHKNIQSKCLRKRKKLNRILISSFWTLKTTKKILLCGYSLKDLITSEFILLQWKIGRITSICINYRFQGIIQMSEISRRFQHGCFSMRPITHLDNVLITAFIRTIWSWHFLIGNLIVAFVFNFQKGNSSGICSSFNIYFI